MTEYKIKSKYKVIDRSTACEILKNIDILLLTATPVETECLHNEMEPFEDHLLKVGIDSYTYYLGKLGNHSVAHVQCRAGSSSSGGSSVVTSHAIGICNPKLVLMIGIAFGMKTSNQKIGDILVSEMIAPYEIKRLGVTNDIYRGGYPKAGIYIANRFLNHEWSNEYKLTQKGKKLVSSKIHHGLLLSGEKLIDDPMVKSKLAEDFPEAIGGEMEGIGLASAVEPHKLEWLVVKAICDFADGNKKKNKQYFQLTAATAAAQYCKSVFSEPYILEDLGINLSEPTEKVTESNVNDVLFKIYNPQSEPFYILRTIDSQFNGYLSNYSIWLHGISGGGKSSVIMRNLSMSGYKAIPINLAAAGEYDAASILKDIYYKLCLFFNLEIIVCESKSIDELTIIISQVINDNLNFDSHIIYLDEIPEYKNDNIFNTFFRSLYAINLNVHQSRPEAKFIFVLSSITSPLIYLHDSQKKILESFKIIELFNWDDNDILKLTDTIQKNIGLNLSKVDQTRIVCASKGSPRNVKRLFRDFVSTRDLPDYSLERIIQEMEDETK